MDYKNKFFPRLTPSIVSFRLVSSRLVSHSLCHSPTSSLLTINQFPTFKPTLLNSPLRKSSITARRNCMGKFDRDEERNKWEA